MKKLVIVFFFLFSTILANAQSQSYGINKIFSSSNVHKSSTKSYTDIIKKLLNTNYQSNAPASQSSDNPLTEILKNSKNTNSQSNVGNLTLGGIGSKQPSVTKQPSGKISSAGGLKIIKCYFLKNNNSSNIEVVPNQNFQMVVKFQVWDDNSSIRSQVICGVGDTIPYKTLYDGYPGPFPGIEKSCILNWIGSNSLTKFDVTLKKFHSANENSAINSFKYGGILKFKIGNITVVADVNVPGISVGGINTGVIQSISGRDVSGGGISGLRIVQEDRKYIWYGRGQIALKIAPGTRVYYSFDFGDKFDPLPYEDSFDPYKVSNISRRIFASHIYTESGKIYPIKLNVKLTKRDYNSDGTFQDIPVELHSDPFNVVVVDHDVQYIGFAKASIIGPGNVTGKKYNIDNFTDIIYEDDISQRAIFKGQGLFSFYHELPPGSNSRIKPDRFSGVDPSTVDYKIDFGDGSSTDWIPFAEVRKIDVTDDINKVEKKEFETKEFSHFYNNPGIYGLNKKIGKYKMSFTIRFKVVEYEPMVANGIVYSFNKKLSKYIYSTGKRNISIMDRTPPIISKEQLKEYKGFTGDKLSVNFIVTDNNSEKEIKKAVFYLENFDKPNTYQSFPLTIQNICQCQNGGFEYNLSGGIPLPKNYAIKSDKDKKLRYYLKIIDGEGNINYGSTSLIENKPEIYIYKSSDTTFGKITVFDNDPPSIEYTVSKEGRIISKGVLTENLNDFPTYFSDLNWKDVKMGLKGKIADSQISPIEYGKQPKRIKIDRLKFKLNEDTRYKVSIKAIENVDKVIKTGRPPISGTLFSLVF